MCVFQFKVSMKNYLITHYILLLVLAFIGIGIYLKSGSNHDSFHLIEFDFKSALSYFLIYLVYNLLSCYLYERTNINSVKDILKIHSISIAVGIIFFYFLYFIGILLL